VIIVETVEDGGNPRDPAAIQRLDDAQYRVVPFSEDGDANYKFALHVVARNDARSPAPLTLEVDWGDRAYMVSRRFVHIRLDGDWQFLPVEADGSCGRLRVDLPPGESAIGLSPAYGLADHTKFLAQFAETPFRRTVIGRSEQGRAIESFSIGTGPQRLLVTTRFHPYETAASFCAEGMMRWLTMGGAEQERLFRRFSLEVVPLPNPDGVALGLCKRTSVGGADLSHEAAESAAPEARTLMRLIDTLRPTAFLDIHGWMHFDEDGLHHYDDDLATRFQEATANQQELAGNRWKAYRERPTGGSPRWYSAERYGTSALAVSYRWPDRTPAQMRAIGPATLQAFAATALSR
jgi:hypothetical protein